MTDREIIKEARDLIVMCSLLDKSGQCNEMADKMDKQLSIPVVVFSEAELKAKLEEQKEEIRQWLIDEDFEGLAERL